MASTPAGADNVSQADPTVALALQYAPYVVIQNQREPCGDGEPYVPTDVATVLGQTDVVLRTATGEVLLTAPTGVDLAIAPADSHLAVPGEALKPQCTDEQRFGGSVPAPPIVMYVRLASDPVHPERVALQYWIFWVYNDWNDRHEGDWEMMQLAFNVGPDGQVVGEPIEVAVAQHEGSERRPWDEVERQGTRVVMFPDEIDPAGEFAWLAFGGHWGEQQPSFNNDPTGPTTKDQRLRPIAWMEDEGRHGSVSVPDLGTSVTDFSVAPARRARCCSSSCWTGLSSWPAC